MCRTYLEVMRAGENEDVKSRFVFGKVRLAPSQFGNAKIVHYIQYSLPNIPQQISLRAV